MKDGIIANRWNSIQKYYCLKKGKESKYNGARPKEVPFLWRVHPCRGYQVPILRRIS
jgi:hypothetical protein